jgi:dihydroxyacetone kinase-like predicted kinase
MASLEDIGKNFKEFTPSYNDGVTRIIQNWGNEVMKQMQNNLLKNKSNATSSLWQSITPQVTTPVTGYNLSIMMEDYWIYVENGRAPNRPPIQDIVEWIRNKKSIQIEIISKSRNRIAATNSLAFVIAEKIAQVGTEARPFVSPALKQVTTQTLTTRISKYIVDSLTGE